jgi:D-alanyl-D-alanine carboxypeptidase
MVTGDRTLPECRYDDVRTRYDEPSQWRRTLLDTIYKIPSSYVPGSLVSTERASLNGGYRVRRAVIEVLEALARAARAAGAGVAVQSAYRSYATQKAVFRSWVDQIGYEEALKVSARPGHSEHQLGTAIDFRSASSSRAPWDYDDWATTKPGRWMKQNAWRYGWLMTYTKGDKSETCSSYDPWHYRYVGRETAAAVRDSGMTVRRYLWVTYHSDPAAS